MAKSLFPCLPNEALEKLRKMIVKRKNFLKRSFAKNRGEGKVQKELFVISGLVPQCSAKEDALAEIKKKRNRMSAQISRDRKKLKIQELESNNDQLREEAEKMKQENERLKQQLASFNSCERQRSQ